MHVLVEGLLILASTNAVSYMAGRLRRSRKRKPLRRVLPAAHAETCICDRCLEPRR